MVALRKQFLPTTLSSPKQRPAPMRVVERKLNFITRED